jgi:hypothetical protein
MIEEVHVPARKVVIDPKQGLAGVQAPPQDDATYWKKMSEASKSRAEYVASEKMIKDIGQEAPPPPEPPIQIKGSINLGDFDMQKQGQEAQAALERARLAADERVKALEATVAATNEKMAELRIAGLKDSFETKMAELASHVRAGMNQKTFIEQFNDMQQMAAQLGFMKPDQHPITTPSEATNRLEILRLEHEMKIADRNFDREAKKDEREWQRQMKQLQLEDVRANKALDAEKDRNALLFDLPTKITKGLADAIIRGAEEEEEPVAAPVARQAPVTRQVPVQERQHVLEAGIGEAGEISCPNPKCGTVLGIGPDSTSVSCPVCKTTAQIHRSAVI